MRYCLCWYVVITADRVCRVDDNSMIVVVTIINYENRSIVQNIIYLILSNPSIDTTRPGGINGMTVQTFLENDNTGLAQISASLSDATTV